jgi:hypothetical protein
MPNAESQAVVTAERSKAPDDDHRVVPFRPRRGAAPARQGWPLRASQPLDQPVEGLEKYERGESEDDYRHRMLVNLAALAFTIALSVAGIWLTIQIADMRKTQDCILSGRRNCSPIDVKVLDRLAP